MFIKIIENYRSPAFFHSLLETSFGSVTVHYHFSLLLLGRLQKLIPGVNKQPAKQDTTPYVTAKQK